MGKAPYKGQQTVWGLLGEEESGQGALPRSANNQAVSDKQVASLIMKILSEDILTKVQIGSDPADSKETGRALPIESFPPAPLIIEALRALATNGKILPGSHTKLLVAHLMSSQKGL